MVRKSVQVSQTREISRAREVDVAKTLRTASFENLNRAKDDKIEVR
jgi:hypothetical protein